MLQAKETFYNGYHFRSRKEARTAVFYDTLGIRYIYEPDGYILNGLVYLPDFELYELGYFTEVKGIEPTALEREKAIQLAKYAERNVYIFFGDVWPDEKSENAYVYFPSSWRNGCFDTCYRWTQCPRCGLLGITFFGWTERLSCYCKKEIKRDNSRSPQLMIAYTAARQARFEHGETPLIPRVDVKFMSCLSCGKPIKQMAGRGHRPRLYCSDRCRQQAHREEKRKQLETLITLEKDITTRLATLEKQVFTKKE